MIKTQDLKLQMDELTKQNDMVLIELEQVKKMLISSAQGIKTAKASRLPLIVVIPRKTSRAKIPPKVKTKAKIRVKIKAKAKIRVRVRARNQAKAIRIISK